MLNATIKQACGHSVTLTATTQNKLDFQVEKFRNVPCWDCSMEEIDYKITGGR